MFTSQLHLKKFPLPHSLLTSNDDGHRSNSKRREE
jgi:hypothetical protein